MTSEWDTDIAQTLIVGNFPTSFIDIGTDVPAVIKTWFATHFVGSVLTKAWIGLYVDANNYWWYVIGSGSLETPFLGYGRVSGGTCLGNYIENTTTFPPPVPPARIYSQIDLQAHWWAKTNINFAIDSSDPNQDWTVNGRSMGRGLILSESFTVAFTSTAVAGSEQIAYTMVNSGQYPDNRAYEIKIYSASLKSAAVQSPGHNIRQNNIAGVQLVGGRVNIPATGVDLAGNGVSREGIYLNTSGHIINDILVITVNPQVATAVSYDAAPGLIVIKDVGAASDYPGRPSLV